METRRKKEGREEVDKRRGNNIKTNPRKLTLDAVCVATVALQRSIIGLISIHFEGLNSVSGMDVSGKLF